MASATMEQSITRPILQPLAFSNLNPADDTGSQSLVPIEAHLFPTAPTTPLVPLLVPADLGSNGVEVNKVGASESSGQGQMRRAAPPVAGLAVPLPTRSRSARVKHSLDKLGIRWGTRWKTPPLITAVSTNPIAAAEALAAPRFSNSDHGKTLSKAGTASTTTTLVPSIATVAPSTESTEIDLVWKKVFLRWEPQFKELLPQHMQDASTLTREGLTQVLHGLRDDNQKKAASRALGYMAPFLDRLSDYSEVLDIFAQAHPVLLLLWGSLKTLLLVMKSLKSPPSLSSLLTTFAGLVQVPRHCPRYCRRAAEDWQGHGPLRDVLELAPRLYEAARRCRRLLLRSDATPTPYMQAPELWLHQ